MAGKRGRSGGANALSLEEHKARGSFRPDRHAHLMPAPSAPDVSPADRTRTLARLPADAWRLATQLLDGYEGWTPSALSTLRSYVLSCERLRALEAAAPGDDDRRLHRELRANVMLAKLLNIEPKG